MGGGQRWEQVSGGSYTCLHVVYHVLFGRKSVLCPSCLQRRYVVLVILAGAAHVMV